MAVTTITTNGPSKTVFSNSGAAANLDIVGTEDALVVGRRLHYST